MSTAPRLRPFQVDVDYLREHLDELVESTFSDLQSQFLVLPKGNGFVEYHAFQDAYEVLKRHTAGFANFSDATVWDALRADSLAFVVLRTILGVTQPEWADLARSERGISIPQGWARDIDRECRVNRRYLAQLARPRRATAVARVEALVSVAMEYIRQGAPAPAEEIVHRLGKVDTAEGLVSLQHAADQHVPYAMLLYERFLGRPFATLRSGR